MMRHGVGHDGRSGGETGSGLIEVMVVLTILAFGLLAHAALTGSGHSLTRHNRERRLALVRARAMIETLKSFDFSTCFAAFDEDDGNDPPDAGGPHFDVAGLQPDPADADGRVGRIVFPVVEPGGNAPPELREDVNEPRLGMPFDLDGDGQIDDQPKDSSYVHLPLLVEVRWTGRDGAQRLEIPVWLSR